MVDLLFADLLDGFVALMVGKAPVDLFAAAHAIQGWHADVQVAAADQLGHVAEEEGQQQSSDVAAVNVSVGHDDDAVVAQLAFVPKV